MAKDDDWENRRSCFDHVMRDWGDTVYRLAYSRMGNRADAEDVVQTVFLRLISNERSFKDGEHLKAWLLHVTMNCCRDASKSAWARHRASLEETELYHLADREGVDEFDCDDQHDIVRVAIGKLPDKQRVAIHLFYGEGYKTHEIARLTGQAPGTVRIHLCRARATLRKTLGGIDGWE